MLVIASSIGSNLCNRYTSSRSNFDRPFGHYVRVFVDLDLTKELRYMVLIERQSYVFFLNLIRIGNLPNFCFLFNCTGHSLEFCRKNNLEKILDDKAPRKGPRKVFK